MTRKQQFEKLTTPIQGAVDKLQEVYYYHRGVTFNPMNLIVLDEVCEDLRQDWEAIGTEGRNALEVVEEFLK